MLTRTIHGAPRRGHLSRRGRQELARIAAVSGHVPVGAASPRMAFESQELELIEQLVHHDRTVISSALLTLAGLGTGGARRPAVLDQIGEAARRAQAEGAISSERARQIARHLSRALEAPTVGAGRGHDSQG